ncbi:hypothetical protein LSH36_75g03006 [Paralvinella palmiformis]|uniref:Uncharacterized protein n=1 Tax=Paralvinella palmiformis TaxID=53620 RepID=A0AAD9K3H1_9ANNE|nr:hypothetical protein LSH36_75g03006 [Paralvinella palmiformis]
MLKNSKALARSKSIDQQIEEDRERRQREIQLLILGGASSGKSTFIKQLRLRHGDGYPEVERKRLLTDVYENLADGINILIDNGRRMGIEYSQHESETFASDFKKEFPRWRHYHLASATSPSEGATFTIPETDAITISGCSQDHAIQKQPAPDFSKVARFLDRIQRFWHDEGVQKCFRNSEAIEPRLVYAECYFLQQLSRICEPGYVPTIQDVLVIRKPTIGVKEHIFVVSNLQYRVIDVAGQKNQRKKWIHFFEGVTAVMFFVALNGYCENLEEDSSLNSMQDSLATFDDVVKNQFLVKTDFILFLNKKDLFTEYLKHTKLSVCFPEYTGDDSPDSCIDYVTERFQQRKPAEKEIYCHVACAIDRQLMKTLIDNVMQIIIGINLRLAGAPL